MPYATIDSPNKHFDTTTYTANGGSQTITNSGSMQPDFFWGKVRSTTSNNILINSVVGVSKYLYSNTTASEVTDANYFTSFNSNGFSVGSNNYSNGTTMVAWQWKGGGTGVSNTSGTISSTVSANTTSGFSIVTFTYSSGSPTVGHGLGVAPSMVIVKNRTSTANNWLTYHKSMGATQAMYLNGTNAATTSSVFWNNTAPTSSVFTVSTNLYAADHVAYCFAEVKGFSKAFSYTGNGSADGTFVSLGFKPAWVMVKASSTTGQWAICDNRRGTANTANGAFLFAEASEATNSAPANWDFLSNGLKARAGYAAHNSSGVTYIGLAFAENPFVSSKGIPTCAV